MPQPRKMSTVGIDVYTSQSIVSTIKTLYNDILIYTVMSMFYSAIAQKQKVSHEGNLVNNFVIGEIFTVYCEQKGYILINKQITNETL